MLHANTTNAFQMISYVNAEKDLNTNKHLNLSLENKTSHSLLLASPKIICASLSKQVRSLIYLTCYGNLYKSLQQLLNKSNQYSCNHENTAIFIGTHIEKTLWYDIAITRVPLKDSKTIYLYYQKIKFQCKQY